MIRNRLSRIADFTLFAPFPVDHTWVFFDLNFTSVAVIQHGQELLL
jgi:hypothetical protein